MYRVGPQQRPLVLFLDDHVAAAIRFAKTAAEQQWVPEEGCYRLPDVVTAPQPEPELYAAK